MTACRHHLWWVGLGVAAGVALRVMVACSAEDCSPQQVPPDLGEFIVADAYDPILIGAEVELVSSKGSVYPKLVFVISDGSESWTTTYAVRHYF